MKDRKWAFLSFMSKWEVVDISGFSVEDFLLNREFRIWVLSSEKLSNIQWDTLLRDNPDQSVKAQIAAKIVLNLKSKNFGLDKLEVSALWAAIDAQIDTPRIEAEDCAVIPISAGSIMAKYHREERSYRGYWQWLRVAGILIFAFVLGLGTDLLYETERPKRLPEIMIYEQYSTPPGVKSTLTLQDGSKVMLNSGSSIRYIKNFEADQRILYLKGEAYFEISKDSSRPFSVLTDGVRTTALGTAFNISAYPNEEMNVSLVEGKVAVKVGDKHETWISLEEGEDLEITPNLEPPQKGHFDTELVMAWTEKKIIFKKVKMEEAIRVLENWYGVKFTLKNEPPSDLYVYGRYEDENLENVLEGLSYTARFHYVIDQDQVKIFFN